MAVDFELDLNGLNELMKSPEMIAILEEACDTVQNSAGAGFNHRVGVATWTAIGNVFADSKESAHLAYKDNRLLKALNGFNM